MGLRIVRIWFFFKNDKNAEISAEDILSIKIEEECPFKTFDKVLVRNSKDALWYPTLFCRFENELKDYKFKIISGQHYRYCIPYEGNEYLAFTTKDE